MVKDVSSSECSKVSLRAVTRVCQYANPCSLETSESPRTRGLHSESPIVREVYVVKFPAQEVNIVKVPTQEVYIVKVPSYERLT